MIPPRSLRLCGEKGVPPLFSTLTVLLSPALSLPKGPSAGEYTTPGRGRQPAAREADGARTLSTWPLLSAAILYKPLKRTEIVWHGTMAYELLSPRRVSQ